MIVKLTYFKESGKYYTDGEYETQKEDLHDIWDEVRKFVRMKNLPGLAGGWLGAISIDVPDHPHNHPRLIMPS